MASSELAAMLERRHRMIEVAEEEETAAKEAAKVEGKEGGWEGPLTPPPLCPSLKIWNPYNEFQELTRKEIQHCQKMFSRYDTNKDKFIDFQELKHMMEKLGSPQTHLALKAMIREVDEDHDARISYREFLLIFRKARAGELAEDSGLNDIYRLISEIDVNKEGVKGAKTFFEAKIDEQTKTSRFEQEIRDEQAERKQLEAEKKVRKAAFKATAKFFENKTWI